MTKDEDNTAKCVRKAISNLGEWKCGVWAIWITRIA